MGGSVLVCFFIQALTQHVIIVSKENSDFNRIWHNFGKFYCPNKPLRKYFNDPLPN